MAERDDTLAATRRPAALVATLGTHPAVVTLALDLLLERAVPIQQIMVIHTASSADTTARDRRLDPQIAAGLQSLKRELDTYPTYLRVEPRLRLRTVALEVNGAFVDDVYTEQDARSVFAALFREVQSLKRERYAIHMSIAGGRKTMSAYGMAVAQILFDERDHLWHVLSSRSLEAAQALHRQSPDDASLVPIPVFSLSTVYPGIMALLTSDDPLRDLHVKIGEADSQAQIRGREFVQSLTPLQRRLVDRLMRSIVHNNRTLSNQELARGEGISVSVTARYLSDIYAKLRRQLDLPEEEIVDRELLVYFLTPYYLHSD
ncbi:MAG: CRISPR-associated ring nuclease [Anaerolineae bacterium]